LRCPLLVHAAVGSVSDVTFGGAGGLPGGMSLSASDLSQQVINRNPIFEPKFIEQLLLPPALLSHHSPSPPTDLMVNCIIPAQSRYCPSFSTVFKNYGQPARGYRHLVAPAAESSQCGCLRSPRQTAQIEGAATGGYLEIEHIWISDGEMDPACGLSDVYVAFEGAPAEFLI